MEYCYTSNLFGSPWSSQLEHPLPSPPHPSLSRPLNKSDKIPIGRGGERHREVISYFTVILGFVGNRSP